MYQSSVEVIQGHPSKYVYFPSPVIFVACMLGTPGNVLVIAVYARNLATSTRVTRVHLFALAVVDSVACVSGIILTAVSVPQLSVTLFQASDIM